jgi:transcriptional regulator with XRE-family HTH domain
MREGLHLYSRDMELAGRQIPNTIRKHRKINGYSQKRLAKRLGVSTALISHWERGVTMPGFINIIKLCVLFSVTPTELYYTLFDWVSEQFQEQKKSSEYDA